jgi:hypothetical protein
MIDKSTLDGPSAGPMTIGARVQVHNTYLETWSRGFQVAGIINDAYLVRRVSDGFILPRSFGPGDIRPC